jgi:hypothetical protein
LMKALAKAGAAPAVAVTPEVNQAVFAREGKTYLVLYDKEIKLVGAFFSEDRLPEDEASLADVRVTATAPGGTRSVRELVTGERPAISGGKVTVAVPGTQWRVLEFAR